MITLGQRETHYKSWMITINFSYLVLGQSWSICLHYSKDYIINDHINYFVTRGRLTRCSWPMPDGRRSSAGCSSEFRFGIGRAGTCRARRRGSCRTPSDVTSEFRSRSCPVPVPVLCRPDVETGETILEECSRVQSDDHFEKLKSRKCVLEKDEYNFSERFIHRCTVIKTPLVKGFWVLGLLWGVHGVVKTIKKVSLRMYCIAFLLTKNFTNPGLW
jgi:hypothetical protein